MNYDQHPSPAITHSLKHVAMLAPFETVCMLHPPPSHTMLPRSYPPTALTPNMLPPRLTRPLPITKALNHILPNPTVYPTPTRPLEETIIKAKAKANAASKSSSVAVDPNSLMMPSPLTPSPPVAPGAPASSINHARQLEFDAWVAPIPVTAEHLGPAPSEANAADARPDPQLFHINQLLEEIPGL